MHSRGRCHLRSLLSEDLEEMRERCGWEKGAPGTGPEVEVNSSVATQLLRGGRRQSGKSLVLGYCKGFGFNWKGSFLPGKTRIRIGF